jgi:hypothetical protein
MKTTSFLLSAAVLISQCSSAITPPDAVAKAFTAKFPTATSVSWGKENAKEFEAEFKLNGAEVSANFLIDGTWVETETPMAIADVPAKVAEAVKAMFPDWTVAHADRVDTPKGDNIELDLKKGVQKKKAEFALDGTFVE